MTFLRLLAVYVGAALLTCGAAVVVTAVLDVRFDPTVQTLISMALGGLSGPVAILMFPGLDEWIEGAA